MCKKEGGSLEATKEKKYDKLKMMELLFVFVTKKRVGDKVGDKLET